MSDETIRSDPRADAPDISAARARLDHALVGFNRHANIAEQHRLAVDRFRASRAAFEAATREREGLRDARAVAAFHRNAVRNAVGDFVRLMRDAGMAPEIVLVAVKTRLTLSVTAETPGAPFADTAQLESDAGTWDQGVLRRGVRKGLRSG